MIGRSCIFSTRPDAYLVHGAQCSARAATSPPQACPCRYGRAAGVDWLCLSGETVGCGPEPTSRCEYGVSPSLPQRVSGDAGLSSTSKHPNLLDHSALNRAPFVERPPTSDQAPAMTASVDTKASCVIGASRSRAGQPNPASRRSNGRATAFAGSGGRPRARIAKLLLAWVF